MSDHTTAVTHLRTELDPAGYGMRYFRRFVLDRSSDPTGVSGTGIVAEGCHFTDGVVTLRWCIGNAGFPSTGHYPSLEAVESIHGHNGDTKVVWID